MKLNRQCNVRLCAYASFIVIIFLVAVVTLHSCLISTIELMNYEAAACVIGCGQHLSAHSVHTQCNVQCAHP